MFGVSEAAKGRVLAYLLGGDAKDVLSIQFPMVGVHLDGDSPETTEQGSWPDVVHALLRRFLTEEVISEAYDAV